MITRSFTIPQEIYEKLKLEENQSALITELLKNHYTTSNDLNEQLKDVQDRKTAFLKAYQIQEEKIKDRLKFEVEEKQVQEEIIEMQENKREELINNCITNTKELFNVDITAEQAIEFIDGDYPNIKDYVDKLKKREEKEAKKLLNELEHEVKK